MKEFQAVIKKSKLALNQHAFSGATDYHAVMHTQYSNIINGGFHLHCRVGGDRRVGCAATDLVALAPKPLLQPTETDIVRADTLKEGQVLYQNEIAPGELSGLFNRREYPLGFSTTQIQPDLLPAKIRANSAQIACSVKVRQLAQ